MKESQKNGLFFGCPHIKSYDETSNLIYFDYTCGGACGIIYNYKNYKYMYDDNYYYVYQYLGEQHRDNCGDYPTYTIINSKEEVNVTLFEGNENQFNSLVWKIDKNLKLISVESK